MKRARCERRPAGAHDTELGKTPMAEDQRPVRERVHNVRGHQNDHHRRHMARGLKESPRSPVKKQRQQAPRHRPQIGDRQLENVRVDPPSWKPADDEQEDCRQGNRQREGGIDAVQERSMAIFELARAEGLRDQGVQAEQQAHPEHGDAEEDSGAEAHGPDRFRAQPPHHQGIDGGHRGPAELRHHDGKRETQHRRPLFFPGT